jgi:DNA-binding MarR family transcriptional regulator
MKNILNKLDKILESRIRLGIMSILVVNERIDFNALKDYLEITDGNLASHLLVLEKNEYIQITKQFLGKKPNTSYHATEKGIKAFKQHLDNLESLIKNHK